MGRQQVCRLARVEPAPLRVTVEQLADRAARRLDVRIGVVRELARGLPSPVAVPSNPGQRERRLLRERELRDHDVVPTQQVSVSVAEEAGDDRPLGPGLGNVEHGRCRLAAAS